MKFKYNKDNILILIVICALLSWFYTTYKFLLNKSKPNIYRTEETLIMKNTTLIENNHNKIFIQRANYWIFSNYVDADFKFNGNESVTLTTTSDFTFLDNLVPLLNYWKGPISVGVYAPGDDFFKALKAIFYLRKCQTTLVKKYVSFTLISNVKHLKKPPVNGTYFDINKIFEKKVDCMQDKLIFNTKKDDTYRSKSKLYFPINVARNVAIEAATTHYIFPIDIELYPSRDFIEKFLQMVKHNEFKKNTVFVLPHFEILEKAKVPNTKLELQSMIKNKTAFWFHQKLCASCHKIPDGKTWLNTSLHDDGELGVFKVVKRVGPWEPFYVMTHEKPSFDERFTWEGQSNKMTQGYIQCLLNYDYAILNNAFLVHKPGVKKKKEQNERFKNAVGKTNALIKRTIKPELNLLYGTNKNCKL